MFMLLQRSPFHVAVLVLERSQADHSEMSFQQYSLFIMQKPQYSNSVSCTKMLATTIMLFVCCM